MTRLEHNKRKQPVVRPTRLATWQLLLGAGDWFAKAYRGSQLRDSPYGREGRQLSGERN